MTRYVVDSDILINIQKSGHAHSIAGLGPLPVVITDMVWSELTVGATLNGAQMSTVSDAESMLKAIAHAPSILSPESLEAETFADLQRPPETEGVGEHSVIAYTLHNPNDVAVLLDRKAMYRGVEELRGRVLSFFGFLDVLRRKGLRGADAYAIGKWYVAGHKPARPPLWW